MAGQDDPTHTNLDKGKAYKETGNAFFKVDNFKDALKNYHLAILHLSGLDNTAMNAFVGQSRLVPLQKDEKDDISTTLKACHSNMAACYIKTGNYAKAVVYCDKVLAVDATNIKAQFRKGQALYKLNDLDLAHACLLAAAKQAPNDKGVRDQLQIVKNALTQLEEKSRAELRANLQRK
ncbi:hypothetical protein BC831DRAFT_473823 [Entophlyctis helioformis]|nr:hypothetical protein BC831DRAFT_473823 [Entophlyctis helioformis]